MILYRLLMKMPNGIEKPFPNGMYTVRCQIKEQQNCSITGYFVDGYIDTTRQDTQIIYDNGVRYTGQVNLSGQRHGHGETVLFFGYTYKGEYDEGKMNGMGTLSCSRIVFHGIYDKKWVKCLTSLQYDGKVIVENSNDRVFVINSNGTRYLLSPEYANHLALFFGNLWPYYHYSYSIENVHDVLFTHLQKRQMLLVQESEEYDVICSNRHVFTILYGRDENGVRTATLIDNGDGNLKQLKHRTFYGYKINVYEVPQSLMMNARIHCEGGPIKVEAKFMCRHLALCVVNKIEIILDRLKKENPGKSTDELWPQVVNKMITWIVTHIKNNTPFNMAKCSRMSKAIRQEMGWIPLNQATTSSMGALDPQNLPEGAFALASESLMGEDLQEGAFALTSGRLISLRAGAVTTPVFTVDVTDRSNGWSMVS